MSIFSSSVMGLAGSTYCLLGGCMLVPHLLGDARWISALYPSLFKRFLQASDEEEEAKSDAVELEKDDLAFRLLSYLLLLLGVCRLVTAFYWGCGYVYLGLGTCMAEVGVICHELLRHDSLQLHRGVPVLLANMGLSILYVSSAAPHCK
jgi:hypothetical protein